MAHTGAVKLANLGSFLNSQEASMSKLKTTTREHLPTAEFGLPEQKKYPMPDKRHAANAKARATQQVAAGNLSAADKKKVDRKADRILGQTKH